METIKNKINSGWLVIFLFVLIFSSSQLSAQGYHDPLIDSMISKITLQSICRIVHELTGDTSTIIGGVPYTILTRAWEYEGNQKAAQYIFEKFVSFGYTPRYQTFSETGKNVIAVKTGTKYPNKQFIICGHYDSYPFAPRSIGADDDATGVCGVLEAARVMAPYNFDYTVIFVAMDEEERWLFGSLAYADTALVHGDSIISAINLDMTAYDANNDSKADIITNTPSTPIANIVCAAFMEYMPELNTAVVNSPNSASDHAAFWQKGFKAVWPWENDINPNVNSMRDTITHFNYSYFLRFTRAAVASLIVLAKDYIIYIAHDSLKSTGDTSARVVNAVITSTHPVGRDVVSRKRSAPRLYWKVGNGSFSWGYPFYNNLDTFKFLIPGQQLGSTVYYYLAAQDSLGTIMASLPPGGRGIGPPGIIPPPNLFEYQILKQMSICSNSIPKTLPPKTIAYDTIRIPEQGTIQDFNLNLTVYHTNDSDLFIWVTRPGVPMVQLSTGNGGDGDNYFNTTFDDEASIPITQGTPPFIGTFKPEQNLSALDKYYLQGDWILRVYNNSSAVTGNLASWCLNFIYYDPIGITNNQIPVKSSLSQNYPNPFNSSTRINFSVIKHSNVKVAVYDILGRELILLANGNCEAGDYNVTFNAANFSSGLYLYSLYLDGILFGTRKMILIK